MIELKTKRVPLDITTSMTSCDGWHVVASCVVPKWRDVHQSELLLVLEREVPDPDVVGRPPTKIDNPVPTTRDYLDEPAFMGTVREKVQLGKYTRRFVDLTIDQLLAVLWLLGEYSARADKLEVPSHCVTPGEKRRINAHNALLELYPRNLDRPRSVEEVRRLMGE